ncbi:hypothetical protein N7G274_002795 [Stereocaulon virgatum]|uniref:Uncharacterized protein n=1 Tax=Stereocaulon virgatum TaxID=373712 RepID=A0ABR4AGY8_9LECA
MQASPNNFKTFVSIRMRYLIPAAMLVSTALALPALPPPPSTKSPTSSHHDTSDPDHVYTHTSSMWSEPFSEHYRDQYNHVKTSTTSPPLTHHNASDDHHVHTYTSPIWSEPSSNTSPQPHASNHTNTTSTTRNQFPPSQHHMASNHGIKQELAITLSAKGGSREAGTASPYAPERTQSTSSQHNEYSPTLTVPISVVQPTAKNYLGNVQKPTQMFPA